MSRIGLIIGDEFIPASKTFLSPAYGIQLPAETVRELVTKYNLEIEEVVRACTEYPYKYTAKMNGTNIYFISKEVYHFD